jgi:DNA-binding CsgD family transcriptional regulator/PAS domain-containing protein
MSDKDLFLQTIETVYASALDIGRTPEALELTARLLGGAGAFFNVMHKPTQTCNVLCAVGDRIQQFAAQGPVVPSNPRMASAFHHPVGYVAWDYQKLDEAGMARDPFYAEFLSQFGLRYFVGVALEQTPTKFTFVSVQRTRKQGHVDKREIELMRRLGPHLQRAYDAATRLKTAGEHRSVLENSLDWLSDGVALLRADGAIVYVNDMMRVFAQRRDGFRIVDRTIEFREPVARRHFAAALGAIERLGDPSCDARPADFIVRRDDGMPAFIVSMRPLLCGQMRNIQHAQAEVMVLIHDPFGSNAATSQVLQELFGLTNAEAHLAHALCTGVTTAAYASARCVSLNTVYSHLKRIREKTGCKSVPERVHKFGELSVPLRLNGPLKVSTDSAQRESMLQYDRQTASAPPNSAAAAASNSGGAATAGRVSGGGRLSFSTRN